MTSQPEQLSINMVIPGQMAHYWQISEIQGARNIHEVPSDVYLSPPVVEYLADASLREVLKLQLEGDSRWAIIPVLGPQGDLRRTIRVPRRSLVERAES